MSTASTFLLLSTAVVAITIGSLTEAATIQQKECSLANNEEYFSGFCYRFVNATNAVGFDEAETICQSGSMSLATIDDASVQSFIANSCEMRAWNRAMIGLRLHRTKWQWVKDGSLLHGQGCFVDNTEERDLNLTSQFVYNLKQSDCLDYCRTRPTAKFAGVQAGRQCFCGTDYSPKSPTTNCLTACAGDADTFCGGQGANYIFAINGEYSAWEDGRPSHEGDCGAMVLGKRSLFQWRDLPCTKRLAHICQFGN